MQTLESGQYNALDNNYRKPNARVYVARNYDSIPFEGKFLHSTITNEKFPQHILHSDGRLCLVYSKHVLASGILKYHIRFLSTDTERTVWGSVVNLTTVDLNYNYLNPTIVQILTSNNLGIVVSRNGELYSLIVNTAGAVQTSISSMSITGNNPTLTKIGSTYWLAYEDSGVLYYRTSADFTSWSAPTNLNTETGLSDDHFRPYLYYDSSDKLWLTFERVTDISANPVVKNVYTMLSDDNGSSWDSPVAQTSLVAGEGSAYNPSIVDTSSFRYLSYTIEKQIQNLQYDNGNTNDPRYFALDEVNNRIGMIVGHNVNYYQLVIFDRDTGLYEAHDLDVHGMTEGAVRALAYDAVNQIWVIGTSSDGLIVYLEASTTWKQYNESSTPALASENMGLNTIIKVTGGNIYFHIGHSTSNNHYILNPVTDALTLLGNYDNGNIVALFNQIEVNDNYIIFIQRTHDTGAAPTGRIHPKVRVYSKSTHNLLYEEFMGDGTAYDTWHSPGNISGTIFGAKMGWDGINNKLYCPAHPTATPYDCGIICYTVGSSSLSFDRYISQAEGNDAGLLPHPDSDADKMTIISWLDYNETNQRLYIQTYSTVNATGAQGNRHVFSVLNPITDKILNYYSLINNTEYLANYSDFDALLIKIMISSSFTNKRSWMISDSNKNLIFRTDDGGGSNEHWWHILATEGEDRRVYYRKTEDDSSWTTAAYLTSNTEDGYCNLGYASSRMIAFWHREVNGISELRWDEDLSADLNVSEYVESFSIEKTDEHSANKAVIILSDKLGLFDPLNYSSLLHDYFAENNIIKIQKGNNNNYNDAFYGYIGSGESVYRRGTQITYRLDCWDRSKNFFKKKVTTGLFENKSVEYIADYVAANYMGLAGIEYDTLPTITDVIPTVQFIDEYVMDILIKIYQAYNYFPYFDESGNLKAKAYNYVASVDYTYYKDGTDSVAANKAPAMNIVAFDYEWTDKEMVNKVIVIGETAAAVETTFEEEFMGFIQGAAGWFSKSQAFVFYFSTDKKMYCAEPRLNVADSCGNKFFGGGESMSSAGAGKQLYCTVNQRTSNLIAALFILIIAALITSILWGVWWGVGGGSCFVWNPLAFVAAAAITILGQIGNFYYEIYARPVGDALPETIEAEADDIKLQAKYGIISEEIDNPFLDTYLKCKNLAENELTKAKWFRYIPTIKVLANVAHQVGDVIEAYNPHTGNTYKIYITDITQSYKRGEEDIDIIQGGLIQ